MVNDLMPVESENRGLTSLMGLEVISKASEYAKRLRDIIETQKLYTVIRDGAKPFVHVEGWTTLGAMLGVFPEVVKLERIDRGNMVQGYLVEIEKFNKYKKTKETYEKFIRPQFYSKKSMKIIKDEQGNDLRDVEEIKYLCEVILTTLNGQKLGRAMAICSNLEDGKLLNAEYSIASMAQTRATGKAFRLPFSWVMTLAGYQPTPFEDMEESTTTLSSEETPKAESVEIEPQTVEPSKNEQPEPAAKEEKKYEIAVPKDRDKMKALWGKLVKVAGEIKFDLGAIVKKNIGGSKITVDDLPSLIPAAYEEMCKMAGSKIEI